MRDYPLIEVLRANDATAMEQRMAAETIEQLHAELTRMKIVESGSIEEIAHANKTIEQLQALIKKNKISFEKITEIKWAWDGDCGANNIAECALYDIDELEPQPPEDETCKHNWVSGDNEHVTGCQICLECKMIRAAPSEDKT